MIFSPARNTVLLKRVVEAPPESALLVVPDTFAGRNTMFATVIAVGKVQTTKEVVVKPEIHVGDTVIVPPQIGADYEEDGVAYSIVRYEDVLMRLY